MNKSSFGTHFTVTTWGESHGKALGAVVDGCPAGLSLCEEDIQKFLDRRKPGQSRYTTARKEGDLVEILSGIFEGKTTGTPISLIVRNTDQRSRDYGNIALSYRPGHADYTFDAKYGFRDYRGGGRSSGRETIGRVASGAIASKILHFSSPLLHIFFSVAVIPHGLSVKIRCRIPVIFYITVHDNLCPCVIIPVNRIVQRGMDRNRKDECLAVI